MWLPKSSAPKNGSWFLIIEKESLKAYAPYEFAFWDGECFRSGNPGEEVDFESWAPLQAPPLTPNKKRNSY